MLPEVRLQLPRNDDALARRIRGDAVRAVCSMSPDSTVAEEVLDALGLDPRDGRRPS